MDERLKKAKIPDILHLALHVPIRYHDYRLKNFIDLKEPFFQVEIVQRQKREKFLKVVAFAKNVGQQIELLFFHTSAYHYQVFAPGNILYVTGKLQKSFGKLQLLQPQKVANYKVGKIFPEYKAPLRGDLWRELVEESLDHQALQEEGLPEWVVENILKIHYPDEEFLLAFRKHGGFFGPYLKALKFLEAFIYIKTLRKKRVLIPSLYRCYKDIAPFLENLPFSPTNDQLKAIEDIRKDLSKGVAARRIVVGDVGSGKSLVMFATAFLAYPKRAILMAPTTILATQLYNEAKRLLPDFIQTALVTSQSKEENLENYHFLIGTHALLYKKLPPACVVMIDEQHRFGTQQRQKLKLLVEQSEKAPHFLQFSATPIPRTQAMMQSALVDFSFIKELPFKKDIETKIITKKDFKELLSHITKGLKLGHQVLIVYPLVEESENFHYKSLEEAKDFWQKYFDGVYITHGKDREKDEILQEFRQKGKILLATTVIEVGISLPKLTTIVIVGAENMGLATLHQLRGRVSRTGLKGYCFLYTKDKENRRLQEFSTLQSGFDVAELDLRYRKSGDILTGKEQSGKTFRWLSIANDEEVIEEVKRWLEATTS